MSKLLIDAFDEFGNQWALVAAGTMDDHNAMTVSWGGVGCLWGKSVATVYIRPNRHTYGYFEENEYFTVSFYPEDCKKALGVMGSKSGRDCDKVGMTRLTPQAVENSMTFAQASVTLVCRKMYRQFMDADAMPKDVLDTFYKDGDIHYMFIGEVMDVIENAPVN